MTTVAVVPGSFDPITHGHVDVIERAANQLDEIVVAVLENPSKQGGMFDLSERIELIEASVGHLDGVRVEHFQGLLVEFCRGQGITMIVKGLRAVSDFEYEFQLAGMNRRMAPDIETLFLTPAEQYAYISSSLVKQIARLGGDVSGFVPPAVNAALQKRFG